MIINVWKGILKDSRIFGMLNFEERKFASENGMYTAQCILKILHVSVHKVAVCTQLTTIQATSHSCPKTTLNLLFSPWPCTPPTRPSVTGFEVIASFDVFLTLGNALFWSIDAGRHIELRNKIWKIFWSETFKSEVTRSGDFARKTHFKILLRAKISFSRKARETVFSALFEFKFKSEVKRR